MALAVAEVLSARGSIDPALLAERFAQRWAADPDRGYGPGTTKILRAIRAGTNWDTAAASVYVGQGSFGNGSAMRTPPLGAFFADAPWDRLIAEAVASAQPTHRHPEAAAGAIAVAVTAALAWQTRPESVVDARFRAWPVVLDLTPTSEVRAGLLRAAVLPPETPAADAAKRLGCGVAVSCQDTVPYVVWSALAHLDDYATAVRETIAGGGDCDTTAAMVGGIVILRGGVDCIPAPWRERAEPWQLSGLG